MINLLKSLHLLTLIFISDALFKRQNSLVRSNRLYGESTVYAYLWIMEQPLGFGFSAPVSFAIASLSSIIRCIPNLNVSQMLNKISWAACGSFLMSFVFDSSQYCISLYSIGLADLISCFIAAIHEALRDVLIFFCLICSSI